MRGAPHNGLAMLICRINCRISAGTDGRPGRDLDFQRPVISETCAMPANNGIRPNDDERLAGLRKQLADPAQNYPVDGPKWHPTGATSSQHDDLLPQHEDLGFQ